MKKSGGALKIVLGVLLVVTLLAGGVYAFVQQKAYNKPGNPANTESVAQGKPLYARFCASCHGKNLEGQPDWDIQKEDGSFPAPPHDTSGHTWHHNDAFLFEYTKSGGRAVNPPGFVSEMPQFSEIMTDSEVWAVLAYIKSTWPEHIRVKQANR
ncbi:MAG: cytochrome c [Rhodospirillales bacterium]|jgi:mono/diheme cytochrome c family protein|nr:cytochrome c [Rhodospirillales bacterium]